MWTSRGPGAGGLEPAVMRAAPLMRAALALALGTALLSGCAPRMATAPSPGATPSPAAPPAPAAARPPAIAAAPGAAPPAGAARVQVMASFYPLYEYATRIGGAHADVRSLVPPGAEPHDYDPSARDIAALSGVRLLIYNGAGLEPWVDRLLPALPPSVVRVEATAGLPLAKIGAAPDPHVWLDPVLAQRQADAILDGFAAVDPARRAVYQENAAALRADLEALHQRYAATLARCRSRTFVTAHAAFGYLARRYGLAMIAVGGLSREVEPSPARLKEVVLLARRHGARAIYYEAAASPKVAQTIAREVGAQTRVLNTLERLTPEEQRRGAGYVEVMDENLRQLAQGLGCR